MNENDHSNIIHLLADFITEYSNKLDDPSTCKQNCWEAGMMKAICLINEYYKKGE